MPPLSLPAPPPLPADVLARRAALPMKPAAADLIGELAMLHPLDLGADVDALHAISCGAAHQGREAFDADDVIWRWMSAGPFADAAALGAWLAAQDGAPDGRPFAVRHRASGMLVGVANMIANQPAHLKVELGTIWYGPVAQGTGISREVTELLLAHCFGLGYRRVEWKCDALNERSRRAALAYGFTFEGIQAAHYIVKGRNRDTAWYRMLDSDYRARSTAASGSRATM